MRRRTLDRIARGEILVTILKRFANAGYSICLGRDRMEYGVIY